MDNSSRMLEGVGRTCERQSLESLEAAYRNMARDAYKAVDLLKEVFMLNNLSTDVYTDSKELRERLYVRAGHAEGWGALPAPLSSNSL